MHTTIITPYTLQGSIFANGLKRQNIACTVCAPKNINFTDPRTNAIIFPHQIKNESLKKTLKYLEEISENTPLIFIGKSQQRYLQERYMRRAIFIDESFSSIEIGNIIREMLIKSELHTEEKIEVGKLTLDCKIRYLFFKNKALPLTRKEFFLLELLAKNMGRITTRESIMENVWDKRNFVAQNTIDVYISRLRKKLQTESGGPKIETIPCLGYKLVL